MARSRSEIYRARVGEMRYQWEQAERRALVCDLSGALLAVELAGHNDCLAKSDIPEDHIKINKKELGKDFPVEFSHAALAVVADRLKRCR